MAAWKLLYSKSNFLCSHNLYAFAYTSRANKTNKSKKCMIKE